MSEFAGTARHLSAPELRLWTSFLDASRIIETELESQLTTNHGMTHREYEVLVRIDGAGGQQRLSVLARQIESSPALISQTVDRLAERGWLRRQPSPDDRRGVEAALTAAGLGVLAAAAGPHAELVQALLTSHFPKLELALLGELLGGVADHLRDHRSGVGCSDPDCPVS